MIAREAVSVQKSVFYGGASSSSSIKVFIVSPFKSKQLNICKTYKSVSDIFLNAG